MQAHQVNEARFDLSDHCSVLRPCPRSGGFIEPCQPSRAAQPPTGRGNDLGLADAPKTAAPRSWAGKCQPLHSVECRRQTVPFSSRSRALKAGRDAMRDTSALDATGLALAVIGPVRVWIGRSETRSAARFALRAGEQAGAPSARSVICAGRPAGSGRLPARIDPQAVGTEPRGGTRISPSACR